MPEDLEGKEIWKEAVRDVTPLPRIKNSISIAQPFPPAEHNGNEMLSAPSTLRKSQGEAIKQNTKSPPATQNIPLSVFSMDEMSLCGVLERRTKRQLKQGNLPIDSTIDLHGFTEADAYPYLLNAVSRAYNQGKRCLLVVTGKGKGGEGLLRKRLPTWLGDAAIKNRIIRYTSALPRHGGEGAFYVFLKKNTGNGG